MFCALLRPRYQVSVYRTIGPLVEVLIRSSFLQVMGRTIRFRLSSNFAKIFPGTMELAAL